MSVYPDDSVGLVSTKTLNLDEPLLLSSGFTLNNIKLVYETYGELNKDKSNALLICHALSSDHHVAGYHRGAKNPGWWEYYVGPNKTIDTKKYFVVCCNNIGGCSGSTGPTSVNPEDNKIWGARFPKLRVRDWVQCQYQLMQALHITQWAGIIGGSLGGMQVMRWALEYPQAMRHSLVIASAMKLTAQNIAFNKIAREAISLDLNYHQGDYLQHNTKPKQGLKTARMIGHLTYMSDKMMASKFGRELHQGSFERGTNEDVSFQVESYLEHQGDKFTEYFDANSYILMTKALDYFDLAREYNNDPVKAFSVTESDFFVMSFNSDWRFSPERSREIVNSLIKAKKPVSYVEIKSKAGHDAFLVPEKQTQQSLSAYLKRV